MNACFQVPTFLGLTTLDDINQSRMDCEQINSVQYFIWQHHVCFFTWSCLRLQTSNISLRRGVTSPKTSTWAHSNYPNAHREYYLLENVQATWPIVSTHCVHNFPGYRKRNLTRCTFFRTTRVGKRSGTAGQWVHCIFGKLHGLAKKWRVRLCSMSAIVDKPCEMTHSFEWDDTILTWVQGTEERPWA